VTSVVVGPDAAAHGAREMVERGTAPHGCTHSLSQFRFAEAKRLRSRASITLEHGLQFERSHAHIGAGRGRG